MVTCLGLDDLAVSTSNNSLQDKRKCCHAFAQCTVQPAQAAHDQHGLEPHSRPKKLFSPSKSTLSALRSKYWGSQSGKRPNRPKGLSDRLKGIAGKSPQALTNDVGDSMSSTRCRATVASRYPHLLPFLEDTGAFPVLPSAMQRPLVEIYVSHERPSCHSSELGRFLSFLATSNLSCPGNCYLWWQSPMRKEVIPEDSLQWTSQCRKTNFPLTMPVLQIERLMNLTRFKL